MNLLLIHRHFPGQFRHFAPIWAQRPGCRVLGLGCTDAPGLANVSCLRYPRPAVAEARKAAMHPYLRTLDEAVRHEQAVVRVLLTLRKRGFVPDVILAHPGWGETLYVRDVFPDACLIHFCEWYYATAGSDFGFDPEFPVSLDAAAKVRTRNTLHALNLEQCDLGVTPTRWQWSRHPELHRPRIRIIHEGIHTALLGPDPQATFALADGRVLRAGDPVITYVARNLEPHRGIHRFLRALERIQQQHRHCHALIVGGDGISYSHRPPDAPNWREYLLRAVRLDPERTHFLGRIPFPEYRRVLQVSAVHVYLSYPFVLSWSLLEALACGCRVIASRTAPVEEVIRDGDNGRLVGFFDMDALVEAVLNVLDGDQGFERMRQKGRQEVLERYEMSDKLEDYDHLLVGNG